MLIRRVKEIDTDAPLESGVLYHGKRAKVELIGRTEFSTFGKVKMNGTLLQQGRYMIEFVEPVELTLEDGMVSFRRVDRPPRVIDVAIPLEPVPEILDPEEHIYRAVLERLYREGKLEGAVQDPVQIDDDSDDDWDEEEEFDMAAPLDEYSLIQSEDSTQSEQEPQEEPINTSDKPEGTPEEKVDEEAGESPTADSDTYT